MVTPSRRRSLFRRNVTSRAVRSEEHTSELQSQSNLVCRLLLEKKKKYTLDGLPAKPHRESYTRRLTFSTPQPRHAERIHFSKRPPATSPPRQHNVPTHIRAYAT